MGEDKDLLRRVGLRNKGDCVHDVNCMIGCYRGSLAAYTKRPDREYLRKCLAEDTRVLSIFADTGDIQKARIGTRHERRIDVLHVKTEDLSARLAAVERERDEAVAVARARAGRLERLVEWAIRAMEGFDPSSQNGAGLKASAMLIRDSLAALAEPSDDTDTPATPGGRG